MNHASGVVKGKVKMPLEFTFDTIMEIMNPFPYSLKGLKIKNKLVS